MRSFGAMHDDYLDPDRWLWEPEPYCVQKGCDGLCDHSQEEEYLYVCEECGTKYEVDEEGMFVFYGPSEEDNELISALSLELYRLQRHRPRVTCTVDDFFSHAPATDFEWRDDGGCGDWHVYCCGNEDCQQRWHKMQYLVSMGRKNGFLWVEIESCDEEGDSDCLGRWEQYEDLRLWSYGIAPQGRNDFGEFYADYLDHMWDYFHGWAEYWLHAYRTGTDPCEQIIGRGNVREIALKSVTENMKTLYDMVARGR